MSTSQSHHARDVLILRAGLVLGFAFLIATAALILLTSQSALTVALLGTASFAALIGPGWSLLTLHDSPAEEQASARAH